MIQGNIMKAVENLGFWNGKDQYHKRYLKIEFG